MDVKTEKGDGSLEDLKRRFSEAERRLRVVELDRVDLLQAMRLILRSTNWLLRLRGFNEDLVDELKLLESRLGSESEAASLMEEAASVISKLGGKVAEPGERREGPELPGSVEAGPHERRPHGPGPQGAGSHGAGSHGAGPHDAGRHDNGLDEAGLKEALVSLVDQLAQFKNNRYQRFGEAIKGIVDGGGTAEGLLSAVVHLFLKFIKDYGNELERISSRLSGIIRILLFTEREYSRFLDSSIEELQGGNKRFNDHLAKEVGQIHTSVTEAMGSDDPENLLGLVVEKIDHLFQAVQRKSREDEDRLGALRVEKSQLQNRLDTIRRDYDNFMTQSRSVLRELEVVKMVSLRDQLTGVYNRRAFDEQTKLTLENLEKGSLSAFSLIIFDIDYFREVNNTYGHLAGDRILTSVARVVSETLRSDDFVFRYGGDEFIVVLPEAKITDAAKVAEKLRRQIEAVDFKLSRQSEASIHVTISLGVTEAVLGDTASTLLSRADAALYDSKDAGRNRLTMS